MHFALPPRKSSQPPPYARSSRWTSSYSNKKKRQVKFGVVIFCLGLTVFYLFLRLVSTSSHNESTRIPIGTPEVVLVTLLDDSLSQEYVTKMKDNRDDYASRHGMLRGIYEIAAPMLIVLFDRLQNLLSHDQGLRRRHLSQVLGARPCLAARHDTEPSLDILLLSLTSRRHNEPHALYQRARHGA